MAEAATQLMMERSAKELGAYYTDSQVADFLVWWAVRNPEDTVLDPSFGGGVFLRSAGKRIRELNGTPAWKIFGVELASDVHAEISTRLNREFELARHNLRRSDFFEVLPGQIPFVDAVVGNPPFIRFQRFTGEARQRALSRAAEAGLKLSSLTSSWLPFLVHSIRFLKPGGRLAMVVPFEIGHASYARPVLEHLAKRFESITFISFRKKLFDDLNEDTLLLLAEQFGPREPSARFQLRDLQDAGDLSAIQVQNQHGPTGLRRLDTKRISTGEERLIESLISPKARDLYRELRTCENATRLGELADVGIGYVTGANDFFHLSSEDAERLLIPSRYLRPCVRRGRSLPGLRLTRSDWQGLLKSGEAGYLLELPTSGALPDMVQSYLNRGVRKGVHQTFKCRNRSPWYRVPHVYQPDAFLTYMSGTVPRLIANQAGVVAPNNLHILRLHRDATQLTSSGLAALWQTSLTQLSVEIEGHALGGGMLKLEPGEAEQVLVPFVPGSEGLEALGCHLDEITRTHGAVASTQLANDQLLMEDMGLTAGEVRILYKAAETLRQRRTTRNG